jgi:hypothetical protein
MSNDGIMDQIKRLLSQGKSSREIIQLGYAPGSVYKAQRQMRQQAVPAEDSPASSILLQGSLTMLRDSAAGEMFGVWHPEPAPPCPGCGERVKHWDICLHCNVALPGECHCPPNSAARSEGFTLRELVAGIVDVR